MSEEMPNSAEAEEAVLGSLLIDASCFPLLATKLQPDDFYYLSNRVAYEAITAVATADYIDPIAVSEAGGGPVEWVTGLMNRTPSALRASQYADIVIDRAVRRRLIAAATEVVKLAWDKKLPVEEAQALAEGAMLNARNSNDDRRGSAKEVANRVYERLKEWQDKPLRPGETRWPATGLQALDKALGGLQPGLYIVAGRPSIGKSALLLQMIEGLAGAGRRILYFVIEANAEQMLARSMSALAGVSLQSLRQERVTQDEYAEALDTLGAIADWPLTVIDRATVRPLDVLAEARRVQMEHGGLEAIFIDGLWLMTPAVMGENRTQSLGSISRAMKQIQRELDIPIVMTHQLNRACDARSDPRPLLCDLRDSGDVEQDTDVALMLYREGYYNPNSPEANIAEVWIRKNRLDGPAGECAKFYWKGEHMRFLPLETRREDGWKP